MDITIAVEPYALVPLTDQQIGVLIACSQAHYDGLCRRASQTGGFIFGWRNRSSWALENGDPDPEQKVTLHTIDLCLKVLEAQPYTPDIAVLACRRDLYDFFRRLAQELLRHRETWTTTWSTP